MIGTVARFFKRDLMSFEITSNAPNVVQRTRTYSRFSEVTQEVVDARIYLGIHFRFADTAARTQGLAVAKYVYNNYLQPINGNSGI
jgi:hypothetical protein